MNLKEYYIKLKSDYEYRTSFFAFLTSFITFSFAIYNLVIGLLYSLKWNVAISIYYALLLTIRLWIVIVIKKDDSKKEVRTFILTSVLTLILNIALIAPICMMVLNQKETVTTNLIIAITIAAYTTYKIINSSINFKKTRKTSSILIKEIRTINFIDALVSILTLQNTLIVVNGGFEEKTLILSAVSSSVILVGIIFVTIYSFITSYRSIKNTKSN